MLGVVRRVRRAGVSRALCACARWFDARACGAQRNAKGDFLAAVHDAPHPALLEFKKKVLCACTCEGRGGGYVTLYRRPQLLAGGLFTMMRGHTVFVNPPLIIQRRDLEKGFGILDECLSVLDKAMES